ncbi:MAG: putative integrase [Acidimicrobiales bacterium]|nr:putative integrase [Acidimicrobiales bacterium]
MGVDRRGGAWRDPRAGRIVLADWATQWEATTVHLRPSSRARDDSYLRNHVLPRFGPMRLDAIGVLDVREWIAELNGRGLAPATVHKAYQTLSKVLRAAVEAELLAQSPCRKIELPRVEREEMRFLTPVEIAVLADAIDPRYRCMVLVACYCGLRLGELAGLCRAHVDLETGTIRIIENAVEVKGHIVRGAPKTRAGRRTVPLADTVAAALEHHLDSYTGDEPDAPVFAGSQGGTLRAGAWRTRFWFPAIDAAGFEPLRVHDMRHTAVALWIAAGANPKQIAGWAGHTSVAVVLDRYGHLFDGHEAEVLTRLDAFAQCASGSPDDGESPAPPRVVGGTSERR